MDLSGTPRGGVLTHASVLTVSSYATRTSPVLRGKWILENFLNEPMPPPPPNVPALDEAKIGAAASLRQQMEEHRTNPACSSCHSKMDPLGFGFENFNAIGQWRTKDGKFHDRRRPAPCPTAAVSKAPRFEVLSAQGCAEIRRMRHR